jgi:hypothetical protein
MTWMVLLGRCLDSLLAMSVLRLVRLLCLKLCRQGSVHDQFKLFTGFTIFSSCEIAELIPLVWRNLDKQTHNALLVKSDAGTFHQ